MRDALVPTRSSIATLAVSYRYGGSALFSEVFAVFAGAPADWSCGTPPTPAQAVTGVTEFPCENPSKY